MKIIVKDNYEEMSREAFSLFKSAFEDSHVLGFATGNTPMGLYSMISAQCRAGGLSFKRKKSFNLDEYYPISTSDKGSYRYFMDHNLFNGIDLPKANVNFPNPELNEEDAIYEYKRAYAKQGPIDLQILGIGVNGHIGFNEPGSSASSEIRIVSLTADTIARNRARAHRAITMGVKEILESKSILLLASGVEKSYAVKAALESVPDRNVTASFLQGHDNTTIILDSAAASQLS